MLRHIPFYATLLKRQLTEQIKATNSHVLVYGAVEAHGLGPKGCIASNKTLAEDTGLKESSVKTILSVLARAGWIEVNLDKNNHRKGIQPLMTINPPVNDHKPPRQSPLTIEHSKESTVIENTIVLDTFNHLKEILEEPRSKYLDARRDKLRLRLKIYRPEEIITAANNLANSEFHMGVNDEKKKYATVDFLIRNDVQVDKWLNSSPKRKKFA